MAQECYTCNSVLFCNVNSDESNSTLPVVTYIYEKESDTEITLNIIFDAIINGINLEVNRKHLESIINKELNTDTKELDIRLIKVLCEALIYYINIWTGWQHNHQFRNAWFPHFCEYLSTKTTYIIKNSSQFIDDKSDLVDKGTQTKKIDKLKKLAPYNLVVGGPPSVVNNLIFSVYDGSIVIKQHVAKPWHELKIPQFLNWPYVAIEMKLPDISITRSNEHQVQRFIALEGVPMMSPHLDHIHHITRIPEKSENEFTPYSYTFFSHYFRQLNVVLKKIPNINKQRLVELSALFTEFLKDIKEMKVYKSTMTPYVTVGYNIGRCRYLRSKKMVNSVTLSPHTPINYFELITPQMDVSLNYFKAKQDCNDIDDVTFESLNLLLRKLSEESNSEIETLTDFINNLSVMYKCNLCKENFSGADAYNLATKHFKQLHEGEQLVLCLKCGKQYEIHVLCSQRWCHRCLRK